MRGGFEQRGGGVLVDVGIFAGGDHGVEQIDGTGEIVGFEAKRGEIEVLRAGEGVCPLAALEAPLEKGSRCGRLTIALEIHSGSLEYGGFGRGFGLGVEVSEQRRQRAGAGVRDDLSLLEDGGFAIGGRRVLDQRESATIVMVHDLVLQKF